MTLRCRNQDCLTIHQYPYLHCPNCQKLLLDVKVRDEDTIEFTGDGWSKTFLVRASGQILSRVSTPGLTVAGLQFYDASGRPHQIPLLRLYNQLSEPERELLEP